MASVSARRYARAIFELAQEGDHVDAWAKRLAAVRAVLTDERVRRVLVNPTVPTATRVELVAGLADRGMGKEGLNLAKLLVASRRVGVIDGIVEEYDRLADESADRVRATATTAVELSDGDRRRVGKELSERLGKEVRLEVEVDPAILGGLVTQIGSRVFDGSIARHLARVREQLVQA